MHIGNDPHDETKDNTDHRRLAKEAESLVDRIRVDLYSSKTDLLEKNIADSRKDRDIGTADTGTCQSVIAIIFLRRRRDRVGDKQHKQIAEQSTDQTQYKASRYELNTDRICDEEVIIPDICWLKCICNLQKEQHNVPDQSDNQVNITQGIVVNNCCSCRPSHIDNVECSSCVLAHERHDRTHLIHQDAQDNIERGQTNGHEYGRTECLHRLYSQNKT